jgi:TonB family protein
MRRLSKYLLLLFGVLLVGARSAPSAFQEETLHDENVKLVSFEDLPYPPAARMAKVQGVVVVRVKLEEDGRVLSTLAISGNKALIPDTLSNARKWRFAPNSQRSVVIVYEFRLTDGACHDNSHSLFQLIHQNFASITACDAVING